MIEQSDALFVALQKENWMTGSFARFLLAVPVKMREEDKRKHFVWSFWLILLALIFMPNVEAFILVFLIGLAKECWDHFYGSGFCLFDMLGNLLGSLAGLSLVVVVSSIVCLASVVL